ncbi:glycosyltransferase family 4 protein [Streptomyces sp. NPDC058052]|uniref:glycosyltransferase family 4 protein n=1 Tax=Streptomyces sp. NPDC058052 TaxID=3346316 RepID=UPI0036E203D5
MKRPRPAVVMTDRTPRASARDASDPFVEARAAHFSRVPGGLPGWHTGFPNLLAELVLAEYSPDGARSTPLRASSGDMALASLRHRLRAGLVPSPDACVQLLAPCDNTRAAVFEIWPEAVRRHGAAAAVTALRRGLHTAREPGTVAFLLDLAAAGHLRPLSSAALLAYANADERRIRHAAWRLLPAYGRAWPPPAGGGPADDAYERLLRDAVRNPPPSGAETIGQEPGTLVVQSMLMGQLDRPGEGLSGGLGVLLGSLGDALARTERVAGVVTLVTACRPELEEDPALLHRRRSGHWILRLPVDSDHQVRPEELGRHREAMAWWATRLFGSLGRPVDVLHLRYADDGSLALAEAGRRAGAGLVFTATPDPHRQITERHDVPGADAAAVRHDLHRVFVADRLVERADRVVGIAGRGGGTDELLRHFPQLAAEYGGAGLSAPPEGIAPYRSGPGEARRREALLRAIDAVAETDAARAPVVLLCVGRLHPVKQQDVLVRAWIESRAFQESVLVIVGGHPRAVDPVERAMRERIGRAVTACPEAGRRLILLPALSNTDVRMLERSLASPVRPFRARYVCPSAKEEFGLALLEAMDAGLLAAGPLRGGVPHYLDDGVNGLLLDTSSARSLGRGLVRLLRVSDEDAAVMARRAQRLVRSTYSSTAMAEALAVHYADVADAGRNRRGRSPEATRSRIRIAL